MINKTTIIINNLREILLPEIITNEITIKKLENSPRIFKIIQTSTEDQILFISIHETEIIFYAGENTCYLKPQLKYNIKDHKEAFQNFANLYRNH